MGTKASRRSVQVCTSKAIPITCGDRAIALNVFAAQKDSGWGKSFVRANKPRPFSDAHDVVLVPICWGTLRTPGSAAHPAASNLLELPAVSPTMRVAVELRGTAAQPASPYPLGLSAVSVEIHVPTQAHANSSGAQASSPNGPILNLMSTSGSRDDSHKTPSAILPSPTTQMSTSSDSVGTNHSAAQPVSHTQGLPTNAQGSSPYGPILNLMSTSDWRDDRLAFALDSDFKAAPSLTLPSPEPPLYTVPCLKN